MPIPNLEIVHCYDVSSCHLECSITILLVDQAAIIVLSAELRENRWCPVFILVEVSHGMFRIHIEIRNLTNQGWDSMARKFYAAWFPDMCQHPKLTQNPRNLVQSYVGPVTLRGARNFCAPLDLAPGPSKPRFFLIDNQFWCECPQQGASLGHTRGLSPQTFTVSSLLLITDLLWNTF